MKTRFLRLLLIGILMLAATLACRLNLGGRSAPDERPTAAPILTPADQIEESLEGALENTNPGESVTITITEAQLTSLLVDYLSTQSEPMLTDPVVVLDNGRIEVYGQANAGILSGNAHMSVEPQVGADGKLHFSIVTAEVGPFPLPDSMLSEVSGMINDAFMEQAGGDRFLVQSVQIDDGLMTITGQMQ